MPPVLRLATEADLEAINAIYNHYVVHSTCTYQEDPSTFEERQAWFTEHGPKHPVLVVEREGVVLGWGSLSRYHSRCGYRLTVEPSLYLHPEARGQGLGSLLMAELIRWAGELGYHTIISGVSAEQAASAALHRKFGYTQVAHLREVGWKMGQWLDVLYFQLMLTGASPPDVS